MQAKAWNDFKLSFKAWYQVSIDNDELVVANNLGQHTLVWQATNA
jgi:hypothetical protein